MEKIQELTEKLYREGVERGQAEAAKIKAEAEAEAQKILDNAREQAQTIEAQAKKKAAELDANTKGELKLYTSQALNALKSEVANVMTHKIISQSVGDLVAQKDFLGQFAVALATQWVENEPITIGSAKAEELKAYFAAHAKALLDKGVTIEQVNNKKTLFTISPADGSYKVNFGQEEFEEYFKNFLRPQLIDMLF